MNTNKIISMIFLVALFPLMPSESWSAQPKRNIHPLKLYEKHCSSCHEPKGEGGKASPLGATGHAWHHPDGQIFLWIKAGRYGPAQRMPGFGNTLSTEEICRLIGLMKNWWDDSQIESQRKVSENFEMQNPCNK